MTLLRCFCCFCRASMAASSRDSLDWLEEAAERMGVRGEDPLKSEVEVDGETCEGAA